MSCEFLRRFLSIAVLLAACLDPARSRAQSTTGTPPEQPTYTFHSASRVVLTDITVTDDKGNPVHSLPQSSFRIFDNNQPQTIISFEEHAGTPTAIVLPAATPGVYSNDFLQHLPPVLSIILIDIANTEIPDQMYLSNELTKFLNGQPDGQPLAIYLRAGSGCFLVQNFTSDRKLLLASLHKAIPRIPPSGRQYLSDIDTLQQIAGSLSQLPGRKNILWFSGGSTLFLDDRKTILQNDPAWAYSYDKLDQERISIYPIDTRGLTNDASRHALMEQHSLMDNVARATGGQAFYGNNGLKEIAEHVVSSDSSFYTATYSPHNFYFDNKWHKVRVAVNGGSYHLSYRGGYSADGGAGGTGQSVKSGIRLLAGGEKLEMLGTLSLPIVFQARVLPASTPSIVNLPRPSGSLPAPPPKKGPVPFSIRYSLPLDAFTLRNVDGKQKVFIGVAAVAFDRDGQAMERNGEQVALTVNEESLRRHHGLLETVDQQLDLTKGDQYLYLAVWDMTSGRLGTLQIPIEVSKPPKRQETATKN